MEFTYEDLQTHIHIIDHVLEGEDSFDMNVEIKNMGMETLANKMTHLSSVIFNLNQLNKTRDNLEDA